jgi:TolB-like protein
VALKRPFPAYNGSEKHVFVCYAHADAATVYPEITELHDDGVNIWYDEGIEVGEEWRAEIAEALDRAESVLFYQSEASSGSRHCVREVSYALNRDIPVIRIDLDGSELPPGLRLGLEVEQAIDPQLYSKADYTAKLLQALDSSTEPNLARPAQAHERQPARWWLYSALVLLTATLIGSLWWTRQQTPTVDNTKATPETPLTSIAVMPFDDLSPGGDQGWLANGMAVELVDSLSRIEGLHVPAGTSTAILKQQQADIRTIGDKLDVRTVVTGSIRRDGDRINVVAHWLRVDGERSLWSKRFESNLDDVFAIQKEIAVGIAEAIREELGIRDVQAAASMSKQRYQTTDVRAWELFRRGFALVFTTNAEKAAEGRELLRRALEYDPNYVEAHAALAWGEFDNPEARIEGARKVLDMEPTNATAYVILIEDSMTLWDFETAEQLFNRAFPANTDSSMLVIHAHHIYAGTGRRGDALAVAQRGVRIDPMLGNHHFFLGKAYLDTGDNAAAVTAFERAISAGFPTGVWGAHAFMRNDQPSEALAAMVKGFPQYEQVINEGWQKGGWQRMNLGLAESLAEFPSAELAYYGEMIKAFLFAAAGDSDAMYAILESLLEATRVIERRDRETYRKVQFLSEAINASAALEPYRAEPQFRALKARLEERMTEAAGTYPYAPAGLDM